MRTGDLRRRIVLQSRLPGQDTYGQRLLVWTDYLAGLATGPARTITGVTAGATTTLQCANHGWQVGQLVRLEGITNFPGLPCTFGVLTATANAFTVGLDTTGLTLTLASAKATPMSGVPCDIRPQTGREQVNDEQLQGEVTHSLVLRYHSQLLDPLKVATLRAIHVHGAVTRIFNLSPALNVDSRNHWLTIQASEGLTQG